MVLVVILYACIDDVSFSTTLLKCPVRSEEITGRGGEIKLRWWSLSKAIESALSHQGSRFRFAQPENYVAHCVRYSDGNNAVVR
jgi:hypothetical protein